MNKKQLVDKDGNPITPIETNPRKFWKIGKGSIFAVAAALTLIAGVFANIQTIIDFCTSDGPKPPRIISIEPDCQVQSRQAIAYSEGAARFDDLASYFRETNEPLFSRLKALQAEQSTGKNVAGATYVAGAAGVGKSFIISELGLGSDISTPAIRLSELYDEKKADLQTLDGKLIFNKLPTISDFSLAKFLAKHNPESKAFVLIDDLDELHEDAAISILREIETFVKAPQKQFIHFVVFGRPEAFWPWLKHSDRTPIQQVTNTPIILNGPDFKTTGDLILRCRLYFERKNKDKAGAEFPAAIGQGFVERLNKFPFLKPTIRPLAAGNFVIEDVMSTIAAGKPILSVAEIRKGLISDLLDRNSESHSRPAMNDDVYMLLLEKAAIFPFEKNRELSANGEFEVHVDDHLEFQDSKGISRSVRLRDIMNRSGITFLDPSDTRRTRYHFEPLWVQEHLIQRWNARNHSGYVYQECK